MVLEHGDVVGSSTNAIIRSTGFHHALHNTTHFVVVQSKFVLLIFRDIKNLCIPFPKTDRFMQ